LSYLSRDASGPKKKLARVDIPENAPSGTRSTREVEEAPLLEKEGKKSSVHRNSFSMRENNLVPID